MTGWPNDARFLFHPAVKELTLDIASVVFMGHEPGTDKELVTKVNDAFTTTTRAGNAIVRKAGAAVQAGGAASRPARSLEDYFKARVKEKRALGRHRHVQRAVPRRRTRTATASPTRTSSAT